MASWQRMLEVFDENTRTSCEIAFFPAARTPPADGSEAVQVRLDQLTLRHPRQ